MVDTLWVRLAKRVVRLRGVDFMRVERDGVSRVLWEGVLVCEVEERRSELRSRVGVVSALLG
jgi:hypothetical protein